MATADLTAQLAAILAERCGVRPADAILVGVSGGADSVALLEALCALKGRGGWQLRLHAAHLNHRLRRQAADADAAFVADLCARHELPVTVESADVADRARVEGVSIEQAGRRCRFQLFERVCTEHNLNFVALGHHADDQAETVLHRIVRGTGVRGLGGMRPVRPLTAGSAIRLIRPLLTVTRVELEAYLRERGVSFRDDASNRSPHYTRNRIRHELLPRLRTCLNPQVDDALRRLADQSAEVYAYLADVAAERVDAVVLRADEGRVEVNRAALAAEPRVIQTELIRQVLAGLGAPEGELSYAHLQRVVDLAAGSEGTRIIQWPGGFEVRRVYDRLVFAEVVPSGREATPSASQAVPGMAVAPIGCTPLSAFGLEVTIDRVGADEVQVDTLAALAGEGGARRYEECLDADAVRLPLVARSLRPGERFDPLGMTGTKKLSDFLIDAKVAPADRRKLVVLCDRDGPVWVVGYRIAHRVRLTDATHTVMRIRVRPGGRSVRGRA